jgi:hypothetical protein
VFVSRQSLKSKIFETFKIPCFYPANGEVLQIWTGLSSVNNIQISNNLVKKRKRDYADSANQVMICKDLKIDEKFNLLLQSIKLQSNFKDLQYDGYIFYDNLNNPKEFPIILDSLEYAESTSDTFNPLEFKDLAMLNHQVTLFQPLPFLNSSSNNVQSHVSKLHAFLILHFHPQISVSIDPEMSMISIHSVRIPSHKSDDNDQNSIQLSPTVSLFSFKISHSNFLEFKMKWSEFGVYLSKQIISLIMPEIQKSSINNKNRNKKKNKNKNGNKNA